MNQANKERVDQIKEIILTLSDVSAIGEIKRFMYNNRMRIYNNMRMCNDGMKECHAEDNKTPVPEIN